jgi:hypothetical protein
VQVGEYCVKNVFTLLELGWRGWSCVVSTSYDVDAVEGKIGVGI